MERKLRWKRRFSTELGYYIFEAETSLADFVIHCDNGTYFATITMWTGLVLETEPRGSLAWCKRECRVVLDEMDCT